MDIKERTVDFDIIPPDRFYQSGRRHDYRAGVLYYLSVIARQIKLLCEQVK